MRERIICEILRQTAEEQKQREGGKEGRKCQRESSVRYSGKQLKKRS